MDPTQQPATPQPQPVQPAQTAQSAPLPTPPPVQIQIPERSRRLELIVLGFGEMVLPIIGLFAIYKISIVQQSLGDNLLWTYVGTFYFVIVIFLAFIQLLAGILSFDKKMGAKNAWTLIVVGLIATALNLPALFYFIIYPIYFTVNAIQ